MLKFRFPSGRSASRPAPPDTAPPPSPPASHSSSTPLVAPIHPSTTLSSALHNLCSTRTPSSDHTALVCPPITARHPTSAPSAQPSLLSPSVRSFDHLRQQNSSSSHLPRHLHQPTSSTSSLPFHSSPIPPSSYPSPSRTVDPVDLDPSSQDPHSLPSSSTSNLMAHTPPTSHLTAFPSSQAHTAPSNPNDHPSSSSNHPIIIVSRKARRKSYGGLRAMLGISKCEEPPPLPTLEYSKPPHHQPHPSIDASPSPSSSFISIPPPPSPVTTESRPSTSSLRPFPFLSGMRRKSANASAIRAHQPPLHSTHTHHTSPQASEYRTTSPNLSPDHPLGEPLSQTTNSSTRFPHRIYSHATSKKAQSVDDLSQFGLLPKPRIKPRRSEELFEPRLTGSKSSIPAPTSITRGIDLHQGLDQIGELAGSLAKISTKTDRMEDRQPRLSNPKGMRTVYGVPIEDLYWRDGGSFPLLVDVLVKLIEEKGLDQQGIYRVPGEKRVIENLQASIDEKGVNGFEIWQDSYKDVHNLSGALKLFLREIPGGVIPFDRYDQFLAVSSVQSESERTTQLQKHVKDLPIPNLILLLRLVRHFERVVENAELNSMLAHNVAIVFAPSLFRSGSEHSNPLLSMQNIGKASAIVRHLVLNADQIFGKPDEEEQLTIGRAKMRRPSLPVEPLKPKTSPLTSADESGQTRCSPRANNGGEPASQSITTTTSTTSTVTQQQKKKIKKSHHAQQQPTSHQQEKRQSDTTITAGKNRASLSGVGGGGNGFVNLGLKKKKFT